MLRGRRGKISSRKRCFNNSRNLGIVNLKEDTEGKWKEGGKRAPEGNIPQQGWTSYWKASGKVASVSLLTVFPFTFQPLTPPSSALCTEFHHFSDKDTHLPKENLANFKAAYFKFGFTLKKLCASFSRRHASYLESSK